MKRIIISISIFAILALHTFANQNDSIDTINLSELSVYSSKETNVRNTPVSATVLGENKIIQSQITSVRDISGKVPNFFIPDYGSAMSGAPYVRGIGSRNSSQSISLYVDNVPYIEKSAFDFELYDIERIEVLRGPQGTLYGRNAMSGHLSVNTLSPLNYQGIKASVSAGNYGHLLAKASFYTKFNDKLGLMVGGYYGQHDGFFFNDFTGKNVDPEKSAGARAKLAWNASNQFKLEYLADFDYIDQGAFPYGYYNDSTKKTSNPNFNDRSDYLRRRINNALSIKHIYQDIVITASLSHQYFEDQMYLDQDFSPQSIFTLLQAQKQNMINGEAIVKSLMSGNYKWLVGVNAYGQSLNTSAPVTFKEDGIKNILQPIFTQIGQAAGMTMTVMNPTLDIPGTYNTKQRGGAMFHQSTFENLLVDGLSLTLGARLDINFVELDYNSTSYLDIEAKRGPMVIVQRSTSELIGMADTKSEEFLPKAALKYEWGQMNYVYGSVSRGYKSGGFNVQMISDLVRNKLESSRPGAPAQETDVKSSIMYLPEHSWNYEIGISNTFLNNKLRTSATLFYMDIDGLQLTEFVASGAGRMLTNAGSAVSKGVELSADMVLGCGFSLGLNYGFAHAAFKHYTTVITEKEEGVEVDKEIDYKGKFIPYAPQHTASTSLNYHKKLNNSFISELYGTVVYSGIGKIYWTEDNSISENFYSLLDAKFGVRKGALGLEIWGKNLLNTTYNAFYFESFDKPYFQKGKPLQFGARLTFDM